MRPGRIVQLSAHMKSSALLAAESLGAFTDLAIRMQPIKAETVRQLGLPPSTTWVWAIVQARGLGQPDALLFGGSADSQSGAEAQARAEFAKWDAKRARQQDAGMQEGSVQ